MMLSTLREYIVTVMASRLRSWLTRDGIEEMLRTARGAELEQAGLRVCIGGIVLAYLAWYVLRDGDVQPDEAQVVAVAISFFVFGVGLTLRILTTPRVSVTRR